MSGLGPDQALATPVAVLRRAGEPKNTSRFALTDAPQSVTALDQRHQFKFEVN
jgi:hypothetical protein